MWRQKFALFAVGVLLLAAACRPGPREQVFGEVLFDIETRIRPERGSIEQRSEIKRTKVSASVAWVIRTDSSWREYRAGLAARLGGEGGFHVKSEDVLEVVFSRELPADVHSLTLELLEAGPPIHVRVTLVAAAW